MSDDKDKGFKVTDRRGASPDSPSPEQGDADESHAQGTLPAELDFGTFVMSLASSALIHLGELMHADETPEIVERRVNLAVAKQTIDIIGMLRDKTRGNLTDDEAKLIEHLLYDLRLKYVEARSARNKG